MKEQYSFVFMIYVEISKLSDIVELRNYYLIWREYSEEPVILWLSGVDGDYYKATLYLRVMNERTSSMRRREAANGSRCRVYGKGHAVRCINFG